MVTNPIQSIHPLITYRLQCYIIIIIIIISIILTLIIVIDNVTLLIIGGKMNLSVGSTSEAYYSGEVKY